MPFEIALPQEAVFTEREYGYRGLKTYGLDINSASTASDPAIWAHRDDYFGFAWQEIEGYRTIEEFKQSICTRPLENSVGYKVFREWIQDGMSFVSLTAWQCESGESAMGRGVLIDAQDKLFLISIPPGDRGKNGGEFFEKALHSIRFLQFSSSSTSSK